MTSDELYKKRICMIHFTNEDFTNVNTKKFKKIAVPQMYKNDQLKVKTPTKTYKNHPFFPCSSQTPKLKNKQQNPDNSFRVTQQNLLNILPSYSTTKYINEIYIQTPVKLSRKTSPRTPDLTPKTISILDASLQFPSPKLKSPRKRLFHEKDQSNNTLVKKLKNIIENQKSLLKNKRGLISKLRRNHTLLKLRSKNTNIINALNFPSNESKIFVKMQVLRKRNSRKSWTREEQTFALSVFYKSPSAYKFLRNSKNMNLPSLSTIRRWVGNSKCKPGFSPGIFKQLKKKANILSEQERYCTLIFDEMKIKNYLEYSKFVDMVEGFENLGPLGRSNKLAGQAMVFIIRGLYSSWKMPIAYFLPSTSVNHTDLSNLLLTALNKLIDCGFLVVAMICDQGKNNVTALTKDLKMSKDKPYIEVQGSKVFTIFDVPHLYKNFRNNFKSNNFIFEGKETSFKDIKDVYEIDKYSCTSRTLLKITDNHISPGPFQLMSCKLAMQLFSNSMAASMETCMMTKQLQSKTAPQTLLLIKKLNNLLDVLNSTTLYNSNPYKCAISEERPKQLTYLLESKSWIESLRKIKKKKREKSRPPCFDGLIWTINSIELLYEQQKEIGYKYLLTGRLNSDIIENTFSVFRQRGGYNR